MLARSVGVYADEFQPVDTVFNFRSAQFIRRPLDGRSAIGFVYECWCPSYGRGDQVDFQSGRCHLHRALGCTIAAGVG